MPVITIDQARRYVADNESAAKVLNAYKLEFSDTDVTAAIAAAAREYNDIPPFIRPLATPAHVVDDNNMWFDGIAMQLYQILKQKVAYQDLDFTAGEVVVSPRAKIQKLCDEMIRYFGDRFVAKATQRKKFLNLQGAYGRVG